MSPDAVETRLAVLETKFKDFKEHTDRNHDEVKALFAGLDTKMDAVLLREARREGEAQESKRIAAKISTFISIIIGAIAGVISSYFR